MMTVTVEVNGTNVGHLKIVNRGPLPGPDGKPTDTHPGGRRLYDVTLCGADGQPVTTAQITHRRADGGWPLVHAALGTVLPATTGRHGHVR